MKYSFYLKDVNPKTFIISPNPTEFDKATKLPKVIQRPKQLKIYAKAESEGRMKTQLFKNRMDDFTCIPNL